MDFIFWGDVTGAKKQPIGLFSIGGREKEEETPWFT